MDSGEREMTIINPSKEYWPSRGSNQRPPSCSQVRRVVGEYVLEPKNEEFRIALRIDQERPKEWLGEYGPRLHILRSRILVNAAHKANIFVDSAEGVKNN